MIVEFKKYVDNYDKRSKAIKRKYKHSLRVMQLAKKYATLLNFSEEDIELATLIGLLHDIGRFDQSKLYHTFDDSKSFDHAEYGVKILFDNNIIDMFRKNKKNDNIIKFAISNHNKLVIANHNKTERELLHAKLIRDVDKIDILYQAGELHEIKIMTTKEKISPKVLESIKNHKPVLKKDALNKNDRIALLFSFAFDINNSICLEEVKNNIIELYERVKDKYERLKPVYEEVLNYLNNKTNKNHIK